MSFNKHLLPESLLIILSNRKGKFEVTKTKKAEYYCKKIKQILLTPPQNRVKIRKCSLDVEISVIS